MINTLTTAPLLTYPDCNKQFTRSCYASDVAIGYILSQLDDQMHEHVIEYAGHALRKSELNYTVADSESLAVVEGFRQFHVYLYSSHTTVITDHLVQEHIYKNPQLQATSDVGIFSYKVVISLFSIRRVNSTRLPMLSLDLKIYLAQKMTTLITFSDMLIYLMLTRLLVTSFHMTIQSGNTSYLTNLSQWYHL